MIGVKATHLAVIRQISEVRYLASGLRRFATEGREDVSKSGDSKQYAEESSNLASDNANFFVTGAKAVVGTAARKVAESVGLATPVSTSENQEPAGVMEARTGNPQEAYDRLKGLTEDRWRDVKSPGMKVENLYENATATTQATTRSPSGDTEAKQSNEADSKG
eukprot:jgi/Botrbrau1/15307/Bobra.0096s0010.1